MKERNVDELVNLQGWQKEVGMNWVNWDERKKRGWVGNLEWQKEALMNWVNWDERKKRGWIG